MPVVVKLQSETAVRRLIDESNTGHVVTHAAVLTVIFV
jgi:hypothetical protein